MTTSLLWEAIPNNIVVSEAFAIKIPENADMKRVAPLLCAGVTTWSPIHFSKVKKGDRTSPWPVMAVWGTWPCNIW